MKEYHRSMFNRTHISRGSREVHRDGRGSAYAGLDEPPTIASDGVGVVNVIFADRFFSTVIV